MNRRRTLSSATRLNGWACYQQGTKILRASFQAADRGVSQLCIHISSLLDWKKAESAGVNKAGIDGDFIIWERSVASSRGTA